MIQRYQYLADSVAVLDCATNTLIFNELAIQFEAKQWRLIFLLAQHYPNYATIAQVRTTLNYNESQRNTTHSLMRSTRDRLTGRGIQISLVGSRTNPVGYRLEFFRLEN